MGRSGPAEPPDYPLFSNALLKPFSRVIIKVILGATPYILINGIITYEQFIPSNEPGQSNLRITGEDISVLMDRDDNPIVHPKQSDPDIIKEIINKYKKYIFKADVIEPSSFEQPSDRDRTPSQQTTDRDHIVSLASKYNYVFYVEPNTTEKGKVTAYWGPPKISKNIQKPLTFNMGPDSNIPQPISFQYNPLSPTFFKGSIHDRNTHRITEIVTNTSKRTRMTNIPSWTVYKEFARHKQFRTTGGLTYEQAINQAQSETDKSMDVITANGELDTLRYGDILRARGLVGLRGVGFQYDGYYYVKSVTHQIRRGDYKQSFTLTRDGLKSNTMRLT
jgi:hypothetical protein